MFRNFLMIFFVTGGFLFPVKAVYAQDYYEIGKNQCKQFNMARQLLDCECYAKEFVRRHEISPEKSGALISHEMKDQCYSASLIQIYQKEICLKNSFTLPKGADAEAYCSCYADHYSQIFFQTPDPTTMNGHKKIDTLAETTCKGLEF